MDWKIGRRTAVSLFNSFTLAFFSLGLLFSQLHANPQKPAELALGYGFNVAAWDVDRLQTMGFNWIKVFNPPGSRLPVHVLLRVEASVNQFNNLPAFGAAMSQLAESQAGYVDAYEIGNEPNLDASYGWTTSPNAAHYASLLCTAYTAIKTADPQAKVISAGLAPTGRVTGNWNGHPGHNGLYQDEREFFKEFLAAGGGSCLDGVGYHPYGFRANFDAAPDMPSADPTQNCVNGFCFRGAEKLYALMQQYGYGHKPMWATEFGWLVTPPDHCRADGSWDGRLWQLVTEQEQADNLVGAFQYAAANWPWMEALIVFNLNFNQPGLYQECEQMRYYAVQGRPAETALRDMPKAEVPTFAAASVWPGQLAAIITPTQQPFSTTRQIVVDNVGTRTITFTIQADAGTDLVPVFAPDGGMLTPGERSVVTVAIESVARPSGIYTGSLTISATAETAGLPAAIPLTLAVTDIIYHAYLPAIHR
ncbi:MAG: hypothetical protein IPM39_29145 [Chloroflexi bacterium]|nr:hypothetical protein [Chloroflexota bacterium]